MSKVFNLGDLAQLINEKDRRQLERHKANPLYGSEPLYRVMHGIPETPEPRFHTYFIGKPHGSQFEMLKSWTQNGEVQIVEVKLE